MAKYWLVIYNQQPAGGATGGYKWENDGGTGVEKSAKSWTDPQIARVTKVEASTGQIAATGVRKAYGEGLIESKMLVAEIEETPGTLKNTFVEVTA
jgi:hypothetical protein